MQKIREAIKVANTVIDAAMEVANINKARAHSPLNDVTSPPPKESGTGASEGQWINVRDKMPDNYETVLFITSHKSVEIGEHFDGCWTEQQELIQIDNVTHWRHLPKPPTP